jgi:hypothetical protein
VRVCPSLVRVGSGEALAHVLLRDLQSERHTRCFHDGRDYRDRGEGRDYKIDNEAQQDETFGDLERVRDTGEGMGARTGLRVFPTCVSLLSFLLLSGTTLIYTSQASIST